MKGLISLPCINYDFKKLYWKLGHIYKHSFSTWKYSKLVSSFITFDIFLTYLRLAHSLVRRNFKQSPRGVLKNTFSKNFKYFPGEYKSFFDKKMPLWAWSNTKKVSIKDLLQRISQKYYRNVSRTNMNNYFCIYPTLRWGKLSYSEKN